MMRSIPLSHNEEHPYSNKKLFENCFNCGWKKIEGFENICCRILEDEIKFCMEESNDEI